MCAVVHVHFSQLNSKLRLRHEKYVSTIIESWKAVPACADWRKLADHNQPWMAQSTLLQLLQGGQATGMMLPMCQTARRGCRSETSLLAAQRVMRLDHGIIIRFVVRDNPIEGVTPCRDSIHNACAANNSMLAL